MLILLRQEEYKLFKNYTFRFWTIALFLYALYEITNCANKNEGAYLFKYLSGIPTFLALIMVIYTSTIISSEFYRGTIKNLLSRQYTRYQVFISKIITLILTYMFYTLVIYGILMFSRTITFHQINISYINSHIATLIIHQSLFMIILLSSTLLLNSIFQKNSGTSVALGIILMFGGQFFALYVYNILRSQTWLKWTPLNFFLMGLPGESNKGIQIFMHLNTYQIYIGTIMYSILFLLVSYFIFSKRNI